MSTALGILHMLMRVSVDLLACRGSSFSLRVQVEAHLTAALVYSQELWSIFLQYGIDCSARWNKYREKSDLNVFVEVG